MSIPFERYDEEFLSLTGQISAKLSPLHPSALSDRPSPLPTSSSADVKMAHNLLLQADDLLKQMGLEARGTEDAVIKRDLLGKVSVSQCFLNFVIVRGPFDIPRETKLGVGTL